MVRMVHFMACLLSMSLQAVLIIGVVFVIRKLFSMLRISKKYAMLLWIITFFFLVFPWKVIVSRGFWNGAAAGFVVGSGWENTLDGKIATDEPDGQAANLQPENAKGTETGQRKASQTENFQIETPQTGASWADTSKANASQAESSQKAPKLRRLWDFWKSIHTGHADMHTFLSTLPSLSEKNGKQIFYFLCAVWAGGMLCFLTHGALSYWRLKRNVLCSIHWKNQENQENQENQDSRKEQGGQNNQFQKGQENRNSLVNPDNQVNPGNQMNPGNRENPYSPMNPGNSVNLGSRKDFASQNHWNCSQDGSGIKAQNAVYCTDGIQVPITLGYFKPRIYLPSGMDGTYAEYVIAHENTHIARNDHIKKAAAYLITCLHWPNPAVWLAYYFMAKDMEMACDEETVAKLGMDRKKAYAEALLKLSTGNGAIFAVPPAFGEGNIKERIKNIVHYQKTRKKSAAMAIAAGLFITILFLTANQGDPAAQATAKAAGLENPTAQANGQNPSAQEGPSENSLALSEQSGTADGLVALPAQAEPEGDEFTFTMLRKAFAEKTIGKIDFHKYANGRKAGFDDEPDDEFPKPYYQIFFSFQYDNEDYNLNLSFLKSTDLLEDISITRVSDAEYAWLYTKKDGQEKYPMDLEIYLHTKTAIEDWLTLELPEGYTLGSYYADYHYYGGALISPQVYQPEYPSEYPYDAPVFWTYAGLVCKLDSSILLSENGQLDGTRVPLSNHTVEEVVQIFDPATSGMDCQVQMTHAYHDLYTSRSLGDLELAGTDVRSMETVSEYWYFYFVPEGEEYAYSLSLSAKEFTREEATAIAKTVKLTEDSAAKKQKKDVQHALNAYFSDFLTTMLADSGKDFGRDDFASINGYMAAKWFVTEREIYKAFHGGIHTVDLTGIELCKLTEREDRLEAVVNVRYQYAYDGNDPKEDICHVSCSFRVYLTPTGTAYQVTDIDCYDAKEIIMLKEALQQAGTDLPGSYQLVDGYFDEIQQNAKKMARN